MRGIGAPWWPVVVLPPPPEPTCTVGPEPSAGAAGCRCRLPLLAEDALRGAADEPPAPGGPAKATDLPADEECDVPGEDAPDDESVEDDLGWPGRAW